MHNMGSDHRALGITMQLREEECKDQPRSRKKTPRKVKDWRPNAQEAYEVELKRRLPNKDEIAELLQKEDAEKAATRIQSALLAAAEDCRRKE